MTPSAAAGWRPFVAPALEHGPAWAFLASFAVSPGVPALLALVLERRLLRPRHEFTAFLYGDPALAVSCAAGVWLAGAPGASVPVAGWPAVAVLVLPLVFGVWQARSELRAGLYTRAQLLSPTKLWHQVVVYPVLTYLVGGALLRGIASGAGGAARWAAPAVMAGGFLFWVAANVRDRRRPRVGHPPYDWRRLRPLASMDAMVRPVDAKVRPSGAMVRTAGRDTCAEALRNTPGAARNTPGPDANQRS
ncbi:hypothetical protein [Streptomyces sp. NBC_00083]|uniref:hypothetical protein n=1 Tax=Streptomyces sp. NBC_00083 TaxID=2975647 RepID=UPI0022525D16|nr:hypothetical protein [Streptomyces sp. NBC_00083]MCX5388347.1 hypothetical protein [Streptomyces sp. NBC_00083]